jgi:hypothetical protein
MALLTCSSSSEDYNWAKATKCLYAPLIGYKHVYEVKRLFNYPLTRLLLVIVLVLVLIYASKYVFNSAAHSANAFKNFRDALVLQPQLRRRCISYIKQPTNPYGNGTRARDLLHPASL